MSHANACLAPAGRLRLARCVVDDGWSLRRAAERFQVSVPTAARWAAGYREAGAAGMNDRSSRPHRCPPQPPPAPSGGSCKLRWLRRWGPARIGYHLGLHPSTVHKVLSRYRMARLDWLDRPTGRVCAATSMPIPATWSTSTSRNSAGSLTAAVTRCSAGPQGKEMKRTRARPGYAFLHNAVDDQSRLAYSEILGDERKETAAGFWRTGQSLLRRPRHHGAAGC